MLSKRAAAKPERKTAAQPKNEENPTFNNHRLSYALPVVIKSENRPGLFRAYLEMIGESKRIKLDTQIKTVKFLSLEFV